MAGEATVTVELDRFERKAVLMALADKRNQLIEESRPTDTVNEAIIKVAYAPAKKQRDRDEGR
jgi:hypothetical protein